MLYFKKVIGKVDSFNWKFEKFGTIIHKRDSELAIISFPLINIDYDSYYIHAYVHNAG